MSGWAILSVACLLAGLGVALWGYEAHQRLQQQAGRHRHIEKDVRQQDALQTVGRELPLPAERVK